GAEPADARRTVLRRPRSCVAVGRPSVPVLPEPAQPLEPATHQHVAGDDADRADGDEDERGDLHANSSSRGSSCETFCSSSSASRSFLVSFFGTVTRSRAIRSPLPPSFSFGAPWPRMRSCRPSCVPAGTFSETRSPYGVGTSTVAPSAASAY